MEVAGFLEKAGHKNVFNDISGVNFDSMRDALKGLGFESHDKGGLLKDNTYTEISTGKKFSQEELMKPLKEKFTGADSNIKKDLSW